MLCSFYDESFFLLSFLEAKRCVGAHAIAQPKIESVVYIIHIHMRYTCTFNDTNDTQKLIRFTIVNYAHNRR